MALTLVGGLYSGGSVWVQNQNLGPTAVNNGFCAFAGRGGRLVFVFGWLGSGDGLLRVKASWEDEGLR